MPEMAKALELSERTYHPWRDPEGMKADDVRRLDPPEAENARLKRIVAERSSRSTPCGMGEGNF